MVAILSEGTKKIGGKCKQQFRERESQLRQQRQDAETEGQQLHRIEIQSNKTR